MLCSAISDCYLSIDYLVRDKTPKCSLFWWELHCFGALGNYVYCALKRSYFIVCMVYVYHQSNKSEDFFKFFGIINWSIFQGCHHNALFVRCRQVVCTLVFPVAERVQRSFDGHFRCDWSINVDFPELAKSLKVRISFECSTFTKFRKFVSDSAGSRILYQYEVLIPILRVSSRGECAFRVRCRGTLDVSLILRNSHTVIQAVFWHLLLCIVMEAKGKGCEAQNEEPSCLLISM